MKSGRTWFRERRAVAQLGPLTPHGLSNLSWIPKSAGARRSRSAIRKVSSGACVPYVALERSRRSLLRDHKLDFLDAPQVFAGPTVTYEDDRFAYGEQRLLTLGFLNGVAVSIVHTETTEMIRVISFRKATRNEETFLFKIL